MDAHRTPHMTPKREAELVAAHRAGDDEALGELLAGYQRRIHSICYRMIHDDQTARDLTQDALVKVIENLDSYDGRALLSTWVIRIAMNVCLSHLRRERLRRHAPLESPESEPMEPRDTRGEPTPAGRVEQAEMRQILLKAMDAIDPQARSMIVLRDMQGLDYHRIGEVLEIPVGTVKSRLFRARAALRDAAELEMGRRTADVRTGQGAS